MQLELMFSEKIEEMIYFLVLNHFVPEKSYLADGAFIEENIIYNSSFSRLVFPFYKNPNGESFKLEGTFTDEDTRLNVNTIQGYREVCIFDSIVYLDETIPNHQIKVFQHGKWEEMLREEYERLKPKPIKTLGR